MKCSGCGHAIGRVGASVFASERDLKALGRLDKFRFHNLDCHRLWKHRLKRLLRSTPAVHK